MKRKMRKRLAMFAGGWYNKSDKQKQVKKTMKEGDKLYIRVNGTESDLGADVTIKITKLARLLLDKTVNTTFENSENVKYLFSAAEDGYYEYEVNANADGVELALYDSDKEGAPETMAVPVI